MSVWRIHNALRTGCVDDLDLVMKLAACYLDARQKGIDKQWAEQNFLNQDAFEDVFEAQEELLQIFLSKAESRQIRELDISLTNKIRIILSIILKGRTVRILVQEGKRAYRFLGDDTLFGIVHEACVGNWKEGEEALLVTATKKISIVGGQQRPISNACSLVKLQSDIQGLNKMFFLDQNIFVGSRVQVAAEDSLIRKSR